MGQTCEKAPNHIEMHQTLWNMRKHLWVWYRQAASCEKLLVCNQARWNFWNFPPLCQKPIPQWRIENGKPAPSEELVLSRLTFSRNSESIYFQMTSAGWIEVKFYTSGWPWWGFWAIGAILWQGELLTHCSVRFSQFAQVLTWWGFNMLPCFHLYLYL